MTKEVHSDGSTTEYDYNSLGQLRMMKEVTAGNSTVREIVYRYDDGGNLNLETRTGIDVTRQEDIVRYTYDKTNQLVGVEFVGYFKDTYTYDKAGNLLNDGEDSYTYDLENRMLTRTSAAGTTVYDYDKAGSLIKETAPDGAAVIYTYNA